MRFLLLSLFLLFTTLSFSQTIEVVKFDQLEKRWTKNNDTLYVINYWATWCKPCVEELPYFIKLENEMKDNKFKLILVSLDFPRQKDIRVVPFLEKRNISTEVVILDDDENVWINKVNKDWDGAIPVTQFIKNGKQEFYGNQLHYKELIEIVNKYKL